MTQKNKEININEAYLWDCLEIMKSIPDGSIDAIITDPPYWTTSCKWDTVIPFDLMWEQLKRIIKPNGAIVLFWKQPFTSSLIISNIDDFMYELIWEKSRAWNSMQVCKQPSAIHENIIVFYKKQPTYNDLKFKVDEKYIDKRKSINNSIYNSEHYSWVMVRKADDWMRHPQSILPFNSVWEKWMHPTQKPVPLIEWLIKTYTNEWETVLDFTAWSFTTAVACENTWRKWICIEKDEKYFTIWLNRINDSICKSTKH